MKDPGRIPTNPDSGTSGPTAVAGADVGCFFADFALAGVIQSGLAARSGTSHRPSASRWAPATLAGSTPETGVPIAGIVGAAARANGTGLESRRAATTATPPQRVVTRIIFFFYTEGANSYRPRGASRGWGMQSSSYSAMTISPACSPHAGQSGSRLTLNTRNDS